MQSQRCPEHPLIFNGEMQTRSKTGFIDHGDVGLIPSSGFEASGAVNYLDKTHSQFR